MIKLKILMKNTLSLDNPGDWDSPVSTKLLKEWASIMEEGISQKDLWFVCSCSAQKAVKRPRLVGFWDGSTQALAGALYVVTMLSKFHFNNEENLPDGDEADWDFDPQNMSLSLIFSLQKLGLPLSKLGLQFQGLKSLGYYCVLGSWLELSRCTVEVLVPLPVWVILPVSSLLWTKTLYPSIHLCTHICLRF